MLLFIELSGTAAGFSKSMGFEKRDKESESER